MHNETVVALCAIFMVVLAIASLAIQQRSWFGSGERMWTVDGEKKNRAQFDVAQFNLET